MFPARFAMVDWSFSSQVLTLTFGMMFFLYLFGPVDGWFLTGPKSKLETVAVENKSWNKSCLKQQQIMKQIMFGTATNHETNHVWNRMLVFFLWQDVGKESSFFWLGYVFLVRLTVTVGFGPVDGWFLTGPNSKLERVSASWQQITFGTECWIFLWQDVGKESSLLTGLCIFVWWGWRWDPTDNLHVFFGFLWACWRWVPHRSQNQNWEETIFFKGQSAVLYHEYHTPCAPAQNTHHAYHFQIGSTIKITQTQSPRLQFLDWPTPPRWPFPGSIRSGGGADEED